MMDEDHIATMRKTMAVPVKIFTDRRYGCLEALVHYLKTTQGMRNCEIARLLSRDDRTIWTVLKRHEEKSRL